MHLGCIFEPYNEGRRLSLKLLDLPIRLCIISNMASNEHSVQMSVKLTREQVELRDKLAHHFGIDHAGVMRMALLKLAREEGIALNERMAAPEGTARRKR